MFPEFCSELPWVVNYEAVLEEELPTTCRKPYLTFMERSQCLALCLVIIYLFIYLLEIKIQNVELLNPSEMWTWSHILINQRLWLTGLSTKFSPWLFYFMYSGDNSELEIVKFVGNLKTWFVTAEICRTLTR